MAKASSAFPPNRISRIPPPGSTIAEKYRVVRVLGSGGMGAVLVAHHELLDQQVAIKVLSPEFARSTAARERFFREARAAARLKSEHVGRVMDVGVDNDRPFIVMELLDGCDLEQLLELEGPLDPADVADYVLQTLDAMAQAHAVGIIHRDLKPANLFLALRPDGTSIIKVLDFGISKEEGGTKRLTGPQALGSPEYMSPEQVRNASAVDTRTDIWSVGIVMYELLTGALPFHADGPGETFAAILAAEPAPLRAKRPELPMEYAALVRQCLQRDRAKRFSDVGELAKAIAPFGSGRWSALVESIVQTLLRAGCDDHPSGARIRKPTPLQAIAPQPALAASPSPSPSPERSPSPAPSPRAPTVLSAFRASEIAARRKTSTRLLVASLVVVVGCVAAALPYARKCIRPLHAQATEPAARLESPPVASSPEPSSAPALSEPPAPPAASSSAPTSEPTATRIEAASPAASASAAAPSHAHAKPSRAPRGSAHGGSTSTQPAGPAGGAPKTYEPQDL